jgi:hypothetical protein
MYAQQTNEYNCNSDQYHKLCNAESSLAAAVHPHQPFHCVIQFSCPGPAAYRSRRPARRRRPGGPSAACTSGAAASVMSGVMGLAAPGTCAAAAHCQNSLCYQLPASRSGAGMDLEPESFNADQIHLPVSVARCFFDYICRRCVLKPAAERRVPVGAQVQLRLLQPGRFLLPPALQQDLRRRLCGDTSSSRHRRHPGPWWCCRCTQPGLPARRGQRIFSTTDKQWSRLQHKPTYAESMEAAPT